VNKVKTGTINLPLMLVEVYLIGTLVLYQFGPLKWATENAILFWMYIALYHIAFITGYLIAAKKSNVSINNVIVANTIKNFIIKYMWVFLGVCAVMSIIKYRNVIGTSNFIPWDLPTKFIKGLQNPGKQYYAKFASAKLSNYTGNKLITGILALFAFVISSMIPICVFVWEHIKRSQKIVFFMLVFFEFATWVSIGTNKGIFDLLFLFAAAITIDVIVNFRTNKFKTLKNKVILVYFTVFLLIFSVWFFSWGTTTRIGSMADSIQLTKGVTLRDSSKNQNTEKPIGENPSTKPEVQIKSGAALLLDNFLYGVSSYLCQGYYGMSLAVGEPFTSTYGIGNSYFLADNFKSLFGIDVEPFTYQAKVSDKWDQYGHWHSFYGYMANDVSFIGVVFIMFLLGVFLAVTYKDAIYGQNIFSQCLLPVFVILFLYMPANNQVFGYMQSFCTFFELTILWFVFRKWGAKMHVMKEG
jgi:hypothetical protein